MICLICDSGMIYEPSWRGIFFRDSKETVCKKCKVAFDKVKDPVCGICGLSGLGQCSDCSHWETTEYAGLIHSGKSLYYYNEAMKSFLHRYKFMQDVVLAEVFAGDLRQALQRPGSLIVPIPMHAKKLTERTFPQVDRLLDAAGASYQHLLIKSDTVLGTKTKTERMAVTDLFTWNGEAVPKRILLVDDLYTTGTTLRQAAKVLKEAGAEEIQVFTLIRG